ATSWVKGSAAQREPVIPTIRQQRQARHFFETAKRGLSVDIIMDWATVYLVTSFGITSWVLTAARASAQQLGRQAILLFRSRRCCRFPESTRLYEYKFLCQSLSLP